MTVLRLAMLVAVAVAGVARADLLSELSEKTAEPLRQALAEEKLSLGPLEFGEASLVGSLAVRDENKLTTTWRQARLVADGVGLRGDVVLPLRFSGQVTLDGRTFSGTVELDARLDLAVVARLDAIDGQTHARFSLAQGDQPSVTVISLDNLRLPDAAMVLLQRMFPDQVNEQVRVGIEQGINALLARYPSGLTSFVGKAIGPVPVKLPVLGNRVGDLLEFAHWPHRHEFGVKLGGDVFVQACAAIPESRDDDGKDRHYVRDFRFDGFDVVRQGLQLHCVASYERRYRVRLFGRERTGRLLSVTGVPWVSIGLVAEDGRLDTVLRDNGWHRHPARDLQQMVDGVLRIVKLPSVDAIVRRRLAQEIDQRGGDLARHSQEFRTLVDRGLLRPVDTWVAPDGLWLIFAYPSDSDGSVDPLLAQTLLGTGRPAAPFGRGGDLGFMWSSAGPAPGFGGVHVLEASDPHGWTDNYLIPYGAGATRGEFVWNSGSDGRVPAGYQGVHWFETLEGPTWQDNWLFVKGLDEYEFGLFTAGMPPGWHGVRVAEPDEPPETTWTDNYFCWRLRPDIRIP